MFNENSTPLVARRSFLARLGAGVTVAGTSLASGASLASGQSASGSWQIGFTNAGWQFAVGQDVTVTLFIDREPYPLVLRTLSPTTLSTPLPDTTLVDALRQGYMLTLQLGAVYTTFSLDGSTAAINAAAMCQQGHVASAAPPPAASPASPQAAVSPPALPPAAGHKCPSRSQRSRTTRRCCSTGRTGRGFRASTRTRRTR